MYLFYKINSVIGTYIETEFSKQKVYINVGR